ncbi:hypothetical protein IYC_06791 [Clostridium sporogenes PA 3679]|nr:hypothetical protein IYC_06791 [Clostridium sporogenes PA 3679]
MMYLLEAQIMLCGIYFGTVLDGAAGKVLEVF